MSRTVMPPEPAPTWKRWDKVYPSARFGHWPIAGFVPDFVARQPTPGRLYREDARVLGRVPAARLPVAALPPHAQDLPFQQMWADLERRHHDRLGRHTRIARR